MMTIRLFTTSTPKIHGNATGLELHEKARYRAAALHGRRIYPGPLGELVHRELTAYADFGFRFKDDGLIPRLAAAIHDDVQRQAEHERIKEAE
jgi:hypothetical protein